MSKQVSIVTTLLVLCLSATVCIADGTIHDGDAMFTLWGVPTSELDGPAKANLIPYTGAPDYLFETWWHYRLVDDTREYAFGNPTSESYVGNTATLEFIYTDFDLTLTYQLTEGPAPAQATLTETLSLTNTSDAYLELYFFCYADIDNGNLAHNWADRNNSRPGFDITDPSTDVVVQYDSVWAYRVGAYDSLRDLLTDGKVDDFNDNSGLPFEDDDFTGTYQTYSSIPHSGGFTTSATIRIIPEPSTLFWTGIGGTTWSTATGLNNWKDDGGSAVDYVNGNAVTFNDTATGLTVDISAADVTPASVLFNNSTKDFLVQGTQGIAGSTPLTKQGAGKVILTSTNSYTGLTTVEAGTLELGLMAQAPVLTGGGVDIQGGEILLNYTGGSNPAVTVLAALASSYATGFASGQIYSSTATSEIGLGWIDDTGTKELTIAYAYYGDANLDGAVNATDLNTVLSFYNTYGKVWRHGDFNYDSIVNAVDLNTVLSYYNQSLPSSINVSSYTLDASAIEAMTGAGITVVPEPSSLLLLSMAALGLLAYAWRRRRS